MLQFNKFFSYLPLIIRYFLYGIIFLLTINAYAKYPGHGYIYILFTLIANALLYLGFIKKALFFDAFIGVFFWLGFWLKLTIRVGFVDGKFHEAVGNFDGSGAAFDRGLLVASCGLLSLILVSLIRHRFISFAVDEPEKITQPGLFFFYKRNRRLALSIFVCLSFFVAISNLYLGIYQRGQVPSVVLPYGLGGIYKWLLLFGLASFTAVILKFELLLDRKNPYLVGGLGLFESFASNFSLLSRGMILNSSALFFGLFKSWKSKLFEGHLRFIAAMFLVFVLLFGSSIFLVNYLRSHNLALPFQTGIVSSLNLPNSERKTGSGFSPGEGMNMTLLEGMSAPLFIDRWVGMEGVFAVSSFPMLGMDLWRQAWEEVYSDYGTSFYDLTLITSPYSITEVNLTNYHYISLPGIIAFCFYPGSFLFLFVAMFLVGGIGAAIEIIVYKLGGKNLILCSLLAQVIAFRLASFGYVPMQSYLLFGTLFLNILIIYGADKMLCMIGNRNSRKFSEPPA